MGMIINSGTTTVPTHTSKEHALNFKCTVRLHFNRKLSKASLPGCSSLLGQNQRFLLFGETVEGLYTSIIASWFGPFVPDFHAHCPLWDCWICLQCSITDLESAVPHCTSDQTLPRLHVHARVIKWNICNMSYWQLSNGTLSITSGEATGSVPSGHSLVLLA